MDSRYFEKVHNATPKRLSYEMMLCLSVRVVMEFEMIAVMIIAVVMKGDAIELLKGIGNLTHGCGESRV
jgi:hypothetical protein